MKGAVISFFMVVILIFSAVAIQTAENRSFRKNELDRSLGEAMEQSMKVLTINPIYHIGRGSEPSEFIADFLQGFLMKTTSNSNFTVEIFNVDVGKGLLDVKVTETFKQIVGQGKVSSRKRIVLEDVKKEENTYFTVSFLKAKDNQQSIPEGERVHKWVSVPSGEELSAEILPSGIEEREGYRFCGWKMTKPTAAMGILYDEQNISMLTAWDDMEFVPVYEAK